MRVFELAKKIGMPTKELLNLLRKLEIKVSNHMSTLEESEVQTVMKKKDKPPVKVASKGSKTAKASIAPPPPAAEKKSRVLIKKKPTPEEIAAAEALSAKTEEAQKEIAPVEPPLIPPTAEPLAPIPEITAAQPEGPAISQEEKPAPLGSPETVAAAASPAAPAAPAPELVEPSAGAAAAVRALPASWILRWPLSVPARARCQARPEARPGTA